jgi:uncharacterized protein (DUF1800 family)
MADSPQALVAHVLRRTTFGANIDRIEEFASQGPEKGPASALEFAFGATPKPIAPPTATKDSWDDNLRGWTDNMRANDGGIHEKMTWFWHGHFTTSSAKVGNPLLLHKQQGVLRTHALGNFRQFLRAMVTDPAMLLYLDGSGSSVEAPNENFGREVMELFTLGRGNYAEEDVKAGALAFAGWEVDYDTGDVKLNPERALGGEIIYLGKRGKLGVDEAVDALCSHPSCAPYVTARMYRFLVGMEPTKERLAELSGPFAKDMEILPLVNAILHGPEFLSARLNRPRYPIEWWNAALASIGEFREGEDKDVGMWTLEQLDQIPHQPPNVGGWPEGNKWLSASQHLARASYVWSLSWRMKPTEAIGGTDLVTATLRRTGLHEVSEGTKSALRDAALASAGAADALSISRRLITIATCSPEFGLA